MRLIDADELRLLAIEKLHMVNPLGDITDLIDEAPTIEPSKSTEQNVADVPSGDLISRQEAIEVGNKIVEELALSSLDWDALKYWAKELFDALPSADRPQVNSAEWVAEKEKEFEELNRPTVIRSKTLMPTKDFREWAKRIREVNPNAVVIPCDAEVVSAEPRNIIACEEVDELDMLERMYTEQKWITDRKPKEDGAYMVTLDAFGHHRYIDLMHYGKPLMPNRKVKGKCWYMDDDEWGDVIYDDEDILAWMPLPTPYKGGDTE